MLLDLSFQGGPIFGWRIKDDIAAGDKGFDIREPDRCKQTAKMFHLHRVSANIYGSQQSYVFWHRGLYGSRTELLEIPSSWPLKPRDFHARELLEHGRWRARGCCG